MAQGYYEGYSAPGQPYSSRPEGAERAMGLGRLTGLVGAFLSVSLLVGVGVWSYRLMVRDVTGVPVIRAMAGPMRVSPEDPGGRQAAYQGLAVNSVAAAGGTAQAPQAIALAPQPIDPLPEDRSTAALAAAQPVAPPIAAPAALDETTPALAVDLADATITPIPASVPGISRSPLPRPRPGGATLVAAASPVAAAPAAPREGSDAQAEALLQELVTRLGGPRAADVDPASLTPGTRLVQLGVYDDAASARSAWDAMAARFPAYLDGRGRVIEPATAGGRTFFRLRALGFADEPEARRFCLVFRAENLDCIPTLVR